MTDQYDYNLKNIRSLLENGFTDDELRRFSYDTPNFRPAYGELSQEIGKHKVIDRLIEYAERMLLIDDLLIWARQYNPRRYEQYQPYIVDHPDDGQIFGQNALDQEPETNYHNIRHPYDRCFKIVTTYFSENALEGLASNLKIDYATLPGNNEREKARELILYCQQHKLIESLKQGIEQAPRGIYFVPRLSTKQDKLTNDTHSIDIPESWPPEIRCKSCGKLIRLVDLDEHFANGIELSSEEYDFISQDEEPEQSGNWRVTGLIVCRNCGRENPLVEGHITAHVQENYTCFKCKQTGYMTVNIDMINGWPGTNFARRISFLLICENCNQRGFRRKLLRSFQTIKSLLISNTDIRVKRSSRTSKSQ